MFDIVDKPGCVTKAVMREYFERAINDTPAFKAKTPLGIVTINDKFSHYANPDTDMMWLGFSVGMRCAQRVEMAKNEPPNV